MVVEDFPESFACKWREADAHVSRTHFIFQMRLYYGRRKNRNVRFFIDVDVKILIVCQGRRKLGSRAILPTSGSRSVVDILTVLLHSCNCAYDTSCIFYFILFCSIQFTCYRLTMTSSSISHIYFETSFQNYNLDQNKNRLPREFPFPSPSLVCGNFSIRVTEINISQINILIFFRLKTKNGCKSE